MTTETGNTTTMSLAFAKAARWQFIVTTVVGLIAFALGGKHAALSAVFGGGAAIAGGFVAMRMTRKGSSATPGGALVALLKAEVVKIGVIALVLLAAFKLYVGLVPLALIGGLAAAALMSGAALRTLDEQQI